MNSALNLAQQGFDCILVEKEEELGGNYNKHPFPVSDIYPADYLQKLVKSVMNNAKITIYLGSEVTGFAGVPGDFKAAIRNKKTGETLTVEHENCYGCGLCVATCPEDCIAMATRAG